MKGKNLLIGFLAGGLFLSSVALATDYSKYSTEELSKMRGTLRNATQEEREAFRAEWQKRMQEMSPEERARYIGPPENAPRDGEGRKWGHGRWHDKDGHRWHGKDGHHGRGCCRK